MINSHIKKILYVAVFGLIALIGCILPSSKPVFADAPEFNKNFASQLTDSFVLNPGTFSIDKDKSLRENITEIFYPSKSWNNAIYKIIRDISLWVMICFILRAGASLLFNRNSDDVKKSFWSLIYILIWWVFIYAANRLFWSVLNFNSANGPMTSDISWAKGIWAVVNQFTWEGWVMFVILSAIKGFAFFMAIIMTVITGIKVMAAGEWEKWKKLIKWLVNVVVSLLVIKWVDFIYYIAADSSNFVQNASDFIISAAKVFAYIYWVIIVLMVIVAWYLYITDGWSWSNFKKASNVLVNILLSGLVLFSFLLITYQIFAEFQTGGDAVVDETTVTATTSTATS